MIFPSGNVITLLLLAGSALGAGMGVTAATMALGDAERPNPGLTAIFFSLMAAGVSVGALLHEPSIPGAAIGACFSASVVALTMGLGTALFVAGRATAEPQAPVVVSTRRAGLLLPVSLIVLLIGFSGVIGTSSATILVLEGVVLLPLSARSFQWRITFFKLIQLLVGILLIALSAWTAISVATSWASHNEILRPPVLASLVLGPIIVLPMIPTVATLAEQGFATEAIDAVVLFVILNTSAVVPLLSAIQPGIAFPMLNWRLDSVLIVAVAALLLPASLGRWSLGRAEGLALLALFVAYLMVTLVVTLN